MQAPRQFYLRPNPPTNGLGIGKGKNIKRMCIPESDGTDEDNPFEDSSDDNSDDSRKADPDYCIDTDEVCLVNFRFLI